MELQLTRRPADAREASKMSDLVMRWQVMDEQASKDMYPDLRCTLAHVIPGAPCCLPKVEGRARSHGSLGIHSFLHAVHSRLVCPTKCA